MNSHEKQLLLFRLKELEWKVKQYEKSELKQAVCCKYFEETVRTIAKKLNLPENLEPSKDLEILISKEIDALLKVKNERV